jgi:hypothetical protein
MENVNDMSEVERRNDVKKTLDALYEEAMKLKSIYVSQPSNIENGDKLMCVANM